MAEKPRRSHGMPIGALHPMIDLAELAGWLNDAAGDEAAWTARRLRPILRGAGALTTLSRAHTPSKAPKTARARFYTTLDLLASTCPDIHRALFVAGLETDDDD